MNGPEPYWFFPLLFLWTTIIIGAVIVGIIRYRRLSPEEKEKMKIENESWDSYDQVEEGRLQNERLFTHASCSHLGGNIYYGIEDKIKEMHNVGFKNN